MHLIRGSGRVRRAVAEGAVAGISGKAHLDGKNRLFAISYAGEEHAGAIYLAIRTTKLDYRQHLNEDFHRHKCPFRVVEDVRERMVRRDVATVHKAIPLDPQPIKLWTSL